MTVAVRSGSFGSDGILSTPPVTGHWQRTNPTPHTDMPRKKTIYKVQFVNNGQLYELYAHEISQSNLYAFVEIADIIFGERSNLLVDPSEEKLKAEFGQVQRTYVPIQSVIRIDEVSKEGKNKIIEVNMAPKDNVSSFPVPPFPHKS